MAYVFVCECVCKMEWNPEGARRIYQGRERKVETGTIQCGKETNHRVGKDINESSVGGEQITSVWLMSMKMPSLMHYFVHQLKN